MPNYKLQTMRIITDKINNFWACRRKKNGPIFKKCKRRQAISCTRCLLLSFTQSSTSVSIHIYYATLHTVRLRLGSTFDFVRLPFVIERSPFDVFFSVRISTFDFRLSTKYPTFDVIKKTLTIKNRKLLTFL
jgi:hypothetical protein